MSPEQIAKLDSIAQESGLFQLNTLKDLGAMKKDIESLKTLFTALSDISDRMSNIDKRSMLLTKNILDVEARLNVKIDGLKSKTLYNKLFG